MYWVEAVGKQKKIYPYLHIYIFICVYIYIYRKVVLGSAVGSVAGTCVPTHMNGCNRYVYDNIYVYIYICIYIYKSSQNNEKGI